MDGQNVLAAVATIRDRLQDAISFASRPNEPGYLKLEAAEAWEWYQDSRLEHAGWQSEIVAAREILRTAEYPFPDTWNFLDVSQPQIAFSQVPVARERVPIYGKNGTIIGDRTVDFLWVIGCDESTNVDRSGSEEEVAWLTAGDQPLMADPWKVIGEEDCPANVLDTHVFQQWEQALAEAIERHLRLSELQIEWGKKQLPFEPTRPISKARAEVLISGVAGSNPSQAIDRMVAAGQLTQPLGKPKGKLWVFNLNDFLPEHRQELRPDMGEQSNLS